jgi:hypothetical protein
MNSAMIRKFGFLFVIAVAASADGVLAQDASAAKPSAPAQQQKEPEAERAYSGMYTFLKEGEFVQLTVEEERRVSGFVSRYGEGESDKGAFLDQFFKNAKLEGNRLNFTTEIVHGVSYDFHGTVERGEGKAPGDEAYFVLKGWLTENSSDVNKKVTSRSQEVAFRMFPQEAAK